MARKQTPNNQPNCNYVEAHSAFCTPGKQENIRIEREANTLTVRNCCFIYPFSHTNCDTCFCSRSFSSINSLFIAVNFLFTVWSLEASFLCFSRHLNNQMQAFEPKTNQAPNKSIHIRIKTTAEIYSNPNSKNPIFFPHAQFC